MDSSADALSTYSTESNFSSTEASGGVIGNETYSRDMLSADVEQMNRKVGGVGCDEKRECDLDKCEVVGRLICFM